MVKAEKGAAESALARSRVKTRAGVLVDWLESLDPELVQTSPELQQKLLFSRCLLKLSGSGGGSAGRRERSCQPYLLTMLTHQASWASLRKTVDCVLKSYNPSFDAAAVLDFLSACVDVPKLWHGRAKHQPKHETQQVRIVLPCQLFNTHDRTPRTSDLLHFSIYITLSIKLV